MDEREADKKGLWWGVNYERALMGVEGALHVVGAKLGTGISRVRQIQARNNADLPSLHYQKAAEGVSCTETECWGGFSPGRTRGGQWEEQDE